MSPRSARTHRERVNRSCTGEWSPTIPPPAGINPGWQGLGLRGNRSSGSLERSPSASSGLFIDRDEPPLEQTAGEESVPAAVETPSGAGSEAGSEAKKDGYIKTTSMARFYYRNHASHGNLPVSHSQERLGEQTGKGHNRRKSKSHTDLSRSAPQF